MVLVFYLYGLGSAGLIAAGLIGPTGAGPGGEANNPMSSGGRWINENLLSADNFVYCSGVR